MKVKGLEKWGDDIVEDKLSNGNTLYYVVRFQTYFPVGIYLKDKRRLEVYHQVDENLLYVLNLSRDFGFRIRVWYGDRQTGTSWNDEYAVMGRVGRSTGSIKIPLLVNNKRSLGGLALSVGSIIRVDDIEERRTLWMVDNFQVEEMTVAHVNDELYPYAVTQRKDDGTVSNVANFKTEEKARRWIAFMKGKRYAK